LYSDNKTGTGFIGYLQVDDKSSYVLVTNYHVFPNETYAKDSSISFEKGGEIQLEDVIIENSYKHSHRTKVRMEYVCAYVYFVTCLIIKKSHLS